MKRVKITDILKEFQEGVDFTIESKKKVIFHNEKIFYYLMRQGGEKAKWFYESVKEIIPSSILCSYEENERSGVFTFKSGNNKNSRELENKFERTAAIEVEDTRRKFKNSEIEKQKNELMGENVKGDIKQIGKQDEDVNRHFVDNGNSLVLSTERKGGDEVVEESYIERNQKRREQEAEENKRDLEQQTQNQENSQSQGKKDHQSKEDTNQQKNQPQKIDNKDSNKNIYYGVGLVSLVLFLTSMMVVWVKKKK